MLFALVYFMLPAYVANMVPVFVRRFNVLNVPMDFGITIFGKRIFGPHKTWRGFISGVIAAMIIFEAQRFVYALDYISALSPLDYTLIPWFFGAMIGVGALTGDAFKSFVKRQFNIKPGKQWIPYDQIDYTIGALVFVYPWFFPGWTEAVIIVAISGVLHILINLIGYWLRIKKTKL